MDDALRHSAELLLSQAEQAIDRRNNGLWDREDCIVLLEQFRELLDILLKDQARLEIDSREMACRLRRRYLPVDQFYHPELTRAQ